MRVPLIPIMWRDLPGLVFVVTVLAVVLFMSVRFSGFPNERIVRATLGPDWRCQDVPNSEDLCLRTVPAKAPVPGAGRGGADR